jgi:hypothetical protein
MGELRCVAGLAPSLPHTERRLVAKRSQKIPGS